MFRGTARRMIIGLALAALLGATATSHAGTSTSIRPVRVQAVAAVDASWRWLAALWERLIPHPTPPVNTSGASSDISLGLDPNGG